eukprot:5520724-Pleurochrysis_carterae.AAC.1
MPPKATRAHACTRERARPRLGDVAVGERAAGLVHLALRLHRKVLDLPAHLDLASLDLPLA